MNDPKRIDRILALVKRYWVRYPTLRLGQLIGNTLLGTKNLTDPYYITDAEMEQRLKEILKDTAVDL